MKRKDRGENAYCFRAQFNQAVSKKRESFIGFEVKSRTCSTFFAIFSLYSFCTSFRLLLLLLLLLFSFLFIAYCVLWLVLVFSTSLHWQPNKFLDITFQCKCFGCRVILAAAAGAAIILHLS